MDSERILSSLRAEGYEIAPTYQDADVVVVNTCGFIDAAVDESLDAIGEALAENGRVIVTGCLGARPERILARHPRVLKITGPHAYEDVMSAVHEHAPPRTSSIHGGTCHARLLPGPPDGAQGPAEPRFPPRSIRLTPRHYAYLKISEGCNNRCSFCIIPSLRGRLVSRPIDAVLREAEQLIAAGVKELLVISQDTSAYGADLRYEPSEWRGERIATRFIDLARALGSLAGAARPSGLWVRLHYVYPYPHVDDVIGLMAERRILPYLDIPFQHGSPSVLKRMRRPAHAENALARIRAWRAACPDLAIRSTFIVGFPGETEAEFRELLDWLEEAELDRVGCFKYSPVDGAKANELSDPVPPAVQEERYARFMERAQALSARKLAARVGRVLTVLVDSIEENGTAIARTEADAPEIDGVVRIRGGERLRPGDFAEVEITGADAYDLEARVSGTGAGDSRSARFPSARRAGGRAEPPSAPESPSVRRARVARQA